MKTIGDKKVRLLYCLGEKRHQCHREGVSYHAEIIDLLGDNVAVIDSPSSKGNGNEGLHGTDHTVGSRCYRFRPGQHI